MFTKCCLIVSESLIYNYIYRFYIPPYTVTVKGVGNACNCNVYILSVPSSVTFRKRKKNATAKVVEIKYDLIRVTCAKI